MEDKYADGHLWKMQMWSDSTCMKNNHYKQNPYLIIHLAASSVICMDGYVAQTAPKLCIDLQHESSREMTYGK